MSRELHLNNCDLSQNLTKEILEALKLITGNLKSSPLMDVPELCDYIKSSKPHVRKLIFEKRIPYTKVGRSVRFNKNEIDLWLENNSHYPK